MNHTLRQTRLIKSIVAKPWWWIGGTVATAGMLTSLAISRPTFYAGTQLGRTTYGPFHAMDMVNSGVSGSGMMLAKFPSDASANGATNVTSATSTTSATTTATAGASGNAALDRRMVIETATVQLRVSHARATASRIEQMVAQAGGYVASMEEDAVDRSSMVNMTVRVPAAQFNRLLSQSRGLGTVLDFSQSGQDVTDQYSSLQQQLTERSSEAAAYTRLFGRAQTMKDMIQLQQSLSVVNAQVAQLEAQIHGLNKAVSYATLNLTLSEPAMKAKPRAQPWPIARALARPWHSLSTSVANLVTILAWLVPWAALFAVVTGGVRFWVRRRRR